MLRRNRSDDFSLGRLPLPARFIKPRNGVVLRRLLRLVRNSAR